MTLIDRARRWGEDRNQRWLEKGIEQGRREGFERGRLEGIELGIPPGVEQGWMEVERRLVERLVAEKFGPAAENLAPVLGSPSAPDRMPAIADAVLDCETAEEFTARIADA